MTHVTRKAVRTEGLSPKAALAFLLPAIGTVILVAFNEYAAPHMDTTLKLAVLGLVNALLALAGAWAGKPGSVVVNH